MNKIQRVLAVETSCDDTSVAIVRTSGFVEYMTSLSQDEVHKPFGGVVPEVASRAHSEKILHLIDRAIQATSLGWKDIDGLVVTSRPGLVGSLLVGLVTVKTLAIIYKKPFVGVNHIEGHIWAPFVYSEETQTKIVPNEFLSLAVSGGHTQIIHVKGFGNYTILGKTVDDAAGEAFDKFAKLLGLGYPGGVLVDQQAQHGNPHAYKFPRPMLRSGNLDFSFSGLKTAAWNVISNLETGELSTEIPNLCASYQEAIVDVLLEKLKMSISKVGNMPVTVTGGVSANSRFREKVEVWAEKEKLSFCKPELKYCTDNAAMIGYAGARRLAKGESSSLDLGPFPSSLENDFKYEDF